MVHYRFSPADWAILSVLMSILVAFLVQLWQLFASNKIGRDRLNFDVELLTNRERQRKLDLKVIEPVAQTIATEVADVLSVNPNWAVDALRKAEWLAYRDTVFSTRLDHFRLEKELLVKTFVPWLLDRCVHHLKTHKKVNLLIDAGTTLFPVFAEVGRLSRKDLHGNKLWVNGLHLVTNNIPGIEKLMQNGKGDEWNDHSELALKNCMLLPGAPLPVFGAVVGDETTAFIERYKTDETDEITISLITGNWARIGRTSKVPVVLAKGGDERHLAIKQTMIDVSDETYVIAPLGKLFANHGLDSINEILASHSPGGDYKQAKTADKESTIKLVSTSRSAAGLLLREHWVAIEAAVGGSSRVISLNDSSVNDLVSKSVNNLPHFHVPFVPEGNDVEQMISEFPHDDTRINLKLLHAFHCPNVLG